MPAPASAPRAAEPRRVGVRPRLHGHKGKLLGAHAGAHGAERVARAPQADHLGELDAGRLRARAHRPRERRARPAARAQARS